MMEKNPSNDRLLGENWDDGVVGGPAGVIGDVELGRGRDLELLRAGDCRRHVWPTHREEGVSAAMEASGFAGGLLGTSHCCDLTSFLDTQRPKSEGLDENLLTIR